MLSLLIDDYCIIIITMRVTQKINELAIGDHVYGFFHWVVVFA